MAVSYFIGHGSPMLALEQNGYTEDMRKLGESLGKPDAVVVFTAHWTRPGLMLTATDGVQETIHDFGGFPDELFQVQYPAKGSVRIAEELRERLTSEGIGAQVTDARGLDHGVWVILRHLFPEADVPVIAVSVDPSLPPQEQYRIGQALSGWTDRNVVIIGSGSTVHNFREMSFGRPDAADPWAKEFDDWLVERMRQGETEALFAYRDSAPHGRRATPDYEHFLPLFIALGAGSGEAELLHQSYQYGSLSHLIIRFG
ncbi:dioxygenase [Paenibacillus sp. CC-CFT747]|nr:dioxygenase [Paenibacillus sp. CC-CFT747]